jgi:hypothetical protein
MLATNNRFISLFEQKLKSIISSEKLNRIYNEFFEDEVDKFIDFLELKEDKTFDFQLKNINFSCLDSDKLNSMLKDGRLFSHFSEHWLESICPELIHVSGCKDHDFTNKFSDLKYDTKTWTSNKLDFRPSYMLGKGRTFNEEEFKEKCDKLIYIVISNIDFPNIKLKFVNGSKLRGQYPKGYVSNNKKDFDEFFS